MIMLIKTTKDDAEHHFFIGFSDIDDTEIDQSITAIYYKIWAINTANKMMGDMDKKQMVAR